MAIRIFCLAVVAMVLAACGQQKPAIRSVEPFHIARVEAVEPLPEGAANWQLEDLQQKTSSLAAYVPQTENPRLLRLRIRQVHMKNAAMSFLVGDSNAMSVEGEVLSMDGSATLGSFTSQVSIDGQINGIIGAAMASASNEDKVLQKLNTEAAHDILQKIYGSKAWNAWNRR